LRWSWSQEYRVSDNDQVNEIRPFSKLGTSLPRRIDQAYRIDYSDLLFDEVLPLV
jgi:hypothetical protein